MPLSATPLMRRSAASLFPDDDQEQGRFLAALLGVERAPTEGSARSPSGRSRSATLPLRAVVWLRDRDASAFETMPPEHVRVELPPGVEILQRGERVGGHPAFVSGDCYVVDLSSVLAASAMLESAETFPTPRVLDCCASPGGKSILAARWLAPALILSNEFVLKRLGPLRHNLRRCRIGRAHTQSLSPERLAELAPEAFDLVLVDAPCSGQSLLAKGTDHPGCFHPLAVKGNARRQSRILDAGSASVRPGGFLLYTTCTFSLRENEQVVQRFLKGRSDFEPVAVSALCSHRSPHAPFPCYRFYPHRDEGAGGFAALLRRCGDPTSPSPDLAPELLDYPA